ncbi:MAG: exodeoxyribonuclease VII small subunit [Phycisphaerales bacterium]
MNPADLSYEQAVERLEEIVAQIESGEVGLEASISLYEEGVGLGKHCREILTKAQQRIEELSRDGSRETTAPEVDEDV